MRLRLRLLNILHCSKHQAAFNNASLTHGGVTGVMREC